MNLDTGKSLSKLQSPIGEIIQGFDGQAAWAKTPQGMQTASAAQSAQAKAAAARQMIVLLRSYDKPGFEIAAVGEETINGKALQGVRLTNTATKDVVTLFIDNATGEVGAKRYAGQSPLGGPGEMTEISSGYQTIDGVRVPSKTIMMTGSQVAAEGTVTGIHLNTGVSDAIFTKPAQ